MGFDKSDMSDGNILKYFKFPGPIVDEKNKSGGFVCGGPYAVIYNAHNNDKERWAVVALDWCHKLDNMPPYYPCLGFRWFGDKPEHPGNPEKMGCPLWSIWPRDVSYGFLKYMREAGKLTERQEKLALRFLDEKDKEFDGNELKTQWQNVSKL